MATCSTWLLDLQCNPKGNWQIIDSSFWLPRLGSSPNVCVCVCVCTWLGPMCASEHMCACSVHTYTSDHTGHIFCSWEASLVTEMIKNPPPMQETGVQSLGWEPLEKEMAIHSSILA